MKHALLLLIRSYWRLVPEARRRRCLFRETCSQYVYQQIKTRGVRAGLLALWQRLRACRPGFQLRVRAFNVEVICRDGTIISHAEIGEVIAEAFSRIGVPR